MKTGQIPRTDRIAVFRRDRQKTHNPNTRQNPYLIAMRLHEAHLIRPHNTLTANPREACRAQKERPDGLSTVRPQHVVECLTDH